MTPRRRLPTLVGAAFFLLMVALYLGATRAYDLLVAIWGIEPFAYPFVDTDTVLSAVRCLRVGVDVYVANPCDPLARVYDYSPAWMALAALPIGHGALVPIGLGLDLAFLAALLLLPAARTRRGAWLVAAGVVSSATLFAVERGNNDLVLFVLAAGAATLVTRSRRWRLVGYALALLAGLLKYYPLTMMALAARERPARFVAVALASIAVAALFAWGCWSDLSRALRLIPTGSPFGNMFGAVTVAQGLAERHLIPAAAVTPTRLAMTVAAAIAAAWWSSRPGLRRAVRDLDAREHAFLLAGALLVLGCFLAAQNIGYRAVHLLLVLPPLIALRAGGAGRAGPAAAVALMWGEAWRRGLLTLGYAVGGGMEPRLFWATWLAREALWWWLATLLAAAAIVLLLQSPLVVVAGRRRPPVTPPQR